VRCRCQIDAVCLNLSAAPNLAIEIEILEPNHESGRNH
jgi:hypothetical protein